MHLLHNFVIIISCSFFISSTKILYESHTSSCYANGKAYQCQPSFTNVIEEIPVEATSTCGTNGPEQICRNWFDRSTGQARQYCSICDAEHRSYSPRYLTDRHIPNNQTCWFSGPLLEASNQNEVNITVSLKKSFEVYYVALQMCGTLPDSIAVYKSLDFGVSWRPWQFFSQDCYRAFKMPTTNEHNAQITPANLQEVLCVELKSPDRYNDLGQAETVLPFSTTIGRPAAHPWSQSLIEWMTMTDLKISLMRFLPEKPVPDRFKEFYDNPPGNDQSNTINRKSEPILHFGLSDLAVGGRCKCNGHASRCLKEDSGDITCDCQHNTEGQDCERCKLNYLDKPWDRATRHNANVCKPCRCNNHSEMCNFSMSMFKQTRGQHGGVCVACKHNTAGATCSECAPQFSRDMSVPVSHHRACKECECNLHTNKCKFSHLLFATSNGTSGGVCVECKHNTTGRHCDRCRIDFYRDWAKPFRHHNSCLPCNCHPIGSLKKTECDKHSGQCNCKEGVTGKTCDRCKRGYRQTSSSIRPCMPISGQFQQNYLNWNHDERGSNMDDMANTSPACKKCNEKRKRIKFKKFCRRKAVFRATVQSKESHGQLIRYEMKIQEIWRLDKKAWSILPREAPSLHTYPAWINYEDVRCNCPKITLGQSFLILTRIKYHMYRGNKELLLDNRSVMLPWQKVWRRRLVKFQEQEKEGKCDKFFKKKTKIKEKARLEITGRTETKSSTDKQKSSEKPDMTFNKYGSSYGYYGTHK